jgi:hypothetical protein
VEEKELLAYCAGFFDGEGSVGVYKDHHKKDRQGSLRKNPSTNHTAVFQAAGYVRQPLEIFVEKFGGRITPQYLKDRDKTVYYYRLHQQELVEIALRALLPYLKVKGYQAQLTLEFIEWRKTAHHSFTEEEAGIAARYSEDIKSAKRDLLV